VIPASASGILRVDFTKMLLDGAHSSTSIFTGANAPLGSQNWKVLMRKVLCAVAALALLVEPVVAMPVDPAPVAPTVAEGGQIITAAYGHYRRVGRRTYRRVYRRHHY
jgi:hypothetical protein